LGQLLQRVNWMDELDEVRYSAMSADTSIMVPLSYGLPNPAGGFPEPSSPGPTLCLAEGWRKGVAKALERQNAALVASERAP